MEGIEKFTILNKFMWLETKIKRMNHDRLPPKVKNSYEDLLDQVTNLKVICLGVIDSAQSTSIQTFVTSQCKEGNDE